VPQLYPACAQIEVESAIAGELPEAINIPAGFSSLSPGMQSLSLYLNHRISKLTGLAGMVVSEE
jgi:hypothetical protein